MCNDDIRNYNSKISDLGYLTLLLKEYFAISSLTLFFVTLIDDLLNWILIKLKYILTDVIVTF